MGDNGDLMHALKHAGVFVADVLLVLFLAPRLAAVGSLFFEDPTARFLGLFSIGYLMGLFLAIASFAMVVWAYIQLLMPKYLYVDMRHHASERAWLATLSVAILIVTIGGEAFLALTTLHDKTEIDLYTGEAITSFAQTMVELFVAGVLPLGHLVGAYVTAKMILVAAAEAQAEEARQSGSDDDDQVTSIARHEFRTGGKRDA